MFKALCFRISQQPKDSNMMMKKKCFSELNKLALTIIFLRLCCSMFLSTAQNKATLSVNAGVILDDLNSESAKMWSSCLDLALSDFYASHVSYKTRLVLNTRESNRSVVGAAAAALDLIQKERVRAIIGPVTSMETSFVINLGDQARVPIISFSATSPSLTSLGSSYFFQFAQNDTAQLKAISAVVKAFGWRQAVPIGIDTLHGRGILPYLADALQEVGTRIPYLSVISPSATDDEIVKELYKLMMMQTRVFIVHMPTDLCSRLFIKAKEIGMMTDGYVWITTGGITNRLKWMDSSVIKSMEGVIGFETYVPKTEQLEEFELRWKRQFQEDDATSYFGAELDVFGLWAYDTVFALAMAVEQIVGTTSSFGSQNLNVVSNNSTDLESFTVSPYGPKLCKAISNTRFQGITGNFILIDGQLQSSDFRIINVNGGGARTVGFWTPHHGLVRKMNSADSTCHLGPLVWPGDSLSVPKGWEIPTIGKKLKILVPVKSGFKEFVNVTYDPNTNTSKVVNGYCIEVFKAVREKLPYDIEYEFVAYAKPDGSRAGSYSDLANEVFLGKYDAAVGDITIRADRSLYIDYTFPFTESGVSMIVPIKDNKNINAWVFLKPLTWDLWVTTGCFFIFIGFVVWVLEHRINEDFRGPLLHQIGTSFWFSFSSMVSAPKERVVSNLSRFVVIIWCFVLLILTQNYTASLTSLLTVQQLQPTVTDINLLMKNGENVGYQSGSFVVGILKQLGFQDNKLRTYDTVEQLDELFHNGTAKNGIAAAFDETPYMKLFLATYCSKYTMVEPTFKADGFAFIFPKDSPLTRDVSRAILDVNEGGEMQKIEDWWFRKQESCQETTNNVSSSSLSLESFWGLLLVTGVISSLALLIFVARNLYEHKDIHLDSESSFSKKVLVMLRIYDQKDLSSHTFKKSGLEIHTSYPQSTSSYSNHTEAHNVFAEQTTPYPEHGGLSELLLGGEVT